MKIGLEAGNMSSWLYSGLVKSGFDVVCMETFQAHRFLATYRNKTDKNDARGLAQLVRMGGEDFLRVVSIRSQASQETRVLLAMRDHLVSQKVGLENHIAGVLKPFGVIVERGNVTADTFYRRTLEGLAEAERNGVQVRSYVLPSLNLYMEAVEKIAPLTEKYTRSPTASRWSSALWTFPESGRSLRCRSMLQWIIRSASRSPRTWPHTSG